MVALLEEGHIWLWPVLMFASVGVLEHAGIKIPYFAFFAHDSGIRVKEPPKNMLVAMFIAAALCVGIGVFPHYLYALLPFQVEFSAYDATHVVTQTQILFFGALAIVALHKSGLYPAEIRAVNLDVEWIYRWFAPRAVRLVGGVVAMVDGAFRRVALSGIQVVMNGAYGLHGPLGALGRTWASGPMVFWVTVLLVVYLVFYLT